MTRMHSVDWPHVSQELDAQGSAVIERLLTPAECKGVTALYAADDIFRSRVVMQSHGFGRGEYKYFNYPLPELVAELRTAIYPQSRPHVVQLMQGDAVIFAVHQRPVQGARSVYRVNMRHGVSRVRSGHRQTLGIIFHDAK